MKPRAIVGLLVLGAAAIGAVGFYLWSNGEPANAPASQPAGPKLATRATPPATQPAVPAAQAPSGPDFDVVRVRPDGQTVIAGRADPGASVTVLDGATVVATVTADSHGKWVALPDKALAPGSHELSLTQASPAGAAEQKSANVVVVSVPEP